MRKFSEDPNIRPEDIRKEKIFVVIITVLLAIYFLIWSLIYTIFDALAIMGLAFFVLLLWQVWYSHIRPKLLSIIFIVISIVVFFQTGINLRISRELSETAEIKHLEFRKVHF